MVSRWDGTTPHCAVSVRAREGCEGPPRAGGCALPVRESAVGCGGAMDPMLRGGRLGGLLQGAAPSAAVPSFEVSGFEVEDGTCRYTTSVLPRPGEARLEVDLRWSEMETVVKDLRALFPAMPDELGLPKYLVRCFSLLSTDQCRIEILYWFESRSR